MRSLEAMGGRRFRQRLSPTLGALIFALIVALILPLVGSAFVVMVRLSDAERQARETQHLDIARAFSSEVDRQLLSAEAALRALATSPQLHDRDLAAFYRQSGAVAEQHGARIGLARPDGRFLFNTISPFGTALPEATRSTLVQATATSQRTHVSDFFIGSVSDEPLVGIYIPVVVDEATRYVLTMTFRPERLSRPFAEQQIPKDWTIAIIDRNGTLIGRNQALDRFLGKSVTPDLKVAMEAAPEGLAIPHTKDGMDVYTAFTRSAFSGWTVAFGIPRSIVEAPLRKSLVEIAIAAFVMILICGSVALLTVRRISRSMTALSTAALALGNGEPLPQINPAVREMDEVVSSLRIAVATLASRSEERDRAENALRESERRFRDIAEIGGDWIWESDNEHRFTLFTGDSLKRMASSGLTLAATLGKTRWQLADSDPATDAIWRQHRADLDARRPFRNFQYSVTLPSQAQLHFAVSGKPVSDDNGVFRGYRGTAADVTETVNALRRAECAEALLRDAVDSISEGFVIYDRDDRFVMCNDAYRQLFPHSAELMVPGTPYEDIVRANIGAGTNMVPPEVREEWVAKHLRAHRNANDAVEVELNGGRWLLVTDRRMPDGGIAGLRIDITKLKITEAQLRQSKGNLARAQRLAQVGSFERDLRTGEVVCSEELYRIFGWDHNASPPPIEDFLALIHPDDRAAYEASVLAATKGLPTPPITYRMHCQDGSVKCIYTELDVVLDQSGEAIRRIGTIRDITEMRQAQERQKELERQLLHSQRLEALGTLAGGVAHDLNNTLVPILALSKLAFDELPAESSIREDIDAIIRASEHARDVVKQILAFSRKQALVRLEVDLACVTREALQMLRASVPTTIQIIEQIVRVPLLSGDADELHQLVTNLVTNAAQAIGSEVGRITVRLWPAADGSLRTEANPTIFLSVADTGCGMDEATVERIFEPFFTTKGVGEGTGLGLSVVHGIVTGHGGTIAVHSVPGAGSEFTVSLPTLARFEATTPLEDAMA